MLYYDEIVFPHENFPSTNSIFNFGGRKKEAKSSALKGKHRKDGKRERN